MSRNTDPQTQARFPLTTIIVDEFTDKNIPVPPPQSCECKTVSQVAKIRKIIYKYFELKQDHSSFFCKNKYKLEVGVEKVKENYPK